MVLTYPNLPTLEVLTDYRPKIPLRVLPVLRRIPDRRIWRRAAAVGRIEMYPEIMKQAILAAEGRTLTFQHGGVDYQGS